MVRRSYMFTEQRKKDARDGVRWSAAGRECPGRWLEAQNRPGQLETGAVTSGHGTQAIVRRGTRIEIAHLAAELAEERNAERKCRSLQRHVDRLESLLANAQAELIKAKQTIREYARQLFGHHSERGPVPGSCPSAGTDTSASEATSPSSSTTAEPQAPPHPTPGIASTRSAAASRAIRGADGGSSRNCPARRKCARCPRSSGAARTAGRALQADDRGLCRLAGLGLGGGPRHGVFTAVETERVCARGCTQASGAKLTRRSADLRAAVPPGAVYGYDVEVFVGVQRFVLHRQRLEIRDALCRDYGIELSTGQVSALAARFVAHLETLHRQHAPALARALAADGGYPLHVDATGEDARGTLFLAYAGWRHWVLGAWKLPTECAEAILPHLQAVVADFGASCAVVRNLGRAVTEAVTTALAGRPVPVFSC